MADTTPVPRPIISGNLLCGRFAICEAPSSDEEASKELTRRERDDYYSNRKVPALSGML